MSESLGRLIYLLRRAEKEEIEAFAKALGIELTELQAIEGGEKEPSPELLEKIAELLNLPKVVFSTEGSEPETESSEIVQLLRSLLRHTLEGRIMLQEEKE